MAKTLDYARPTPRKPLLDALPWAVTAAVVEHLLFFGLFAVTFDGGHSARMGAAASMTYVTVLLLILIRQRRRLSTVHLAFVAFGFPVLLIAMNLLN